LGYSGQDYRRGKYELSEEGSPPSNIVVIGDRATKYLGNYKGMNNMVRCMSFLKDPLKIRPVFLREMIE
jgi:hypothetical protein